MMILGAHAARPGRPGTAPGRWPATSRLRPVPGRWNLVLLAHPRCPCTRASLAELARIMARSRGRLAATVVLYHPEGTPESWAQTDLAAQAAAIPNTRVVADAGGAEAERFGAATSGQVVLFDPEGRRHFEGGITSTRGHEGDSLGRAAILDLIQRGVAERPAAPVFGCSIRGDG
jgi:hypothetical protein